MNEIQAVSRFPYVETMHVLSNNIRDDGRAGIDEIGHYHGATEDFHHPFENYHDALV